MANLNKVLLIGRLTRDPELRYTQNGTAVVEFGLAMNRNYTTADGQKKEDTCFVTVIMWQKKAEIISQYMRKGRQIFIEGRLELDSWQTSDGQKRSKLRVVGSNFQFLGPPPDGASSAKPPASAPPPERNEDKYTEDMGIADDDVPF
jgi:single-strand DNA-binding protein